MNLTIRKKKEFKNDVDYQTYLSRLLFYIKKKVKDGSAKYKTSKDYDTEDLWIINDDDEDIKTIERLDREYGIQKVPHPLM